MNSAESPFVTLTLTVLPRLCCASDVTKRAVLARRCRTERSISPCKTADPSELSALSSRVRSIIQRRVWHAYASSP